ncbi:MAG: putative bifunctional diguanylate cyclase/phosphodiesterase [Acidobacteriota bacterium]
MSKTRILIVEDEMIVALDLENRLQSMGYEVIGAVQTGEEAVAKATALHPDLILMDIILKGEVDGIAAAAEINRLLSIPIIFLTASTDEKTLERAKLTGPFAYVLKPFEDRELRGNIEIITYKHSLEERVRQSEERYALAARGANDGLWDWDLVNHRVFFSPRWESMLGYEEGDLGHEPESWFSHIHPSDRQRVRDELNRHLAGKSEHFESEYRMIHRNGTYRWVLTRGLALRNQNGIAVRIAGSQSDVTERKVYDPLTGLPNRTLFVDRLERAMERAQRNRSYAFAVLAAGIHNFSNIKETLGVTAGDQLLINASRLLRSSLPPSDTIASQGDGEFLVLLDDIVDITEASRVASRIQTGLSQICSVAGHDIYTEASVGIAMNGRESHSGEDLILQARTAMRRAGRDDHRRCEIFDDRMRTIACARLEIEAELRRAIEQNAFCIHYQPIVSLKSGHLSGFEALVRWRRDNGDLVYPSEFIPLAEETNLIVPLEGRVLRGACAQMEEWRLRKVFPKPPLLSINLSPKHYSHPGLFEELVDVLRSTGFDPHSLQLEITESAFMEDTEAILQVLKQIKDLRIRLHMDDFGIGYSCLSYLYRFPINALKVDRSFIQTLADKAETQKIVQTIVSLARNLGLEVASEGIEQYEQLRLLQLYGCDHGQGYFFSKPLDVDEVARLVVEPPWRPFFASR